VDAWRAPLASQLRELVAVDGSRFSVASTMHIALETDVKTLYKPDVGEPAPDDAPPSAPPA